MHEFSLAVEVINLVQHEAERRSARSIQEISIEVGDLSGVEADSFESALELLVKDTCLDKAIITIKRIPGIGKCNGCNAEFEMNHRMDVCPICRCFPSEINGGQEFRVVEMVVE